MGHRLTHQLLAILTVLIGITLVSMFFPSRSRAQAVVNEIDIFASPQAVELVNTTNEPVNISGWYLDDSGGTTYLTIPAGSLIAPGACVVVRGNLNLNTASSDTVRLMDSTAPPTGVAPHLIDSYTYTQVPAPGSNYSRIPDGTGTFVVVAGSLGLWNSTSADCTVPSPSPQATPSSTPTLPSITPSSSPTSSPLPLPTPSPTPPPDPKIYLWEVMPNPTDGSEWVEIYNDTDTAYDLSGWKLDDIIDGGSVPTSIQGLVPARGYLVVEMHSHMFNDNDPDSVRLIDPAGTEAEIFMYTTTHESISWGRRAVGEDTFCLQSPSKGIANNPCISQSPTLSPSMTPPPSPTSIIPPPDHIFLSELYVNTESGQSEWIELYNDNRYEVTLDGWSIRDATGQTIARIAMRIDAYRYGVVTLTSPRMNNDDEIIELLSPLGMVVDRFAYDDSTAGTSWGRSPSFTTWCMMEPSQGRTNSSCRPDPTATPTPSPDLSSTPTPTRTRTPTPTTRVSVGSSRGGSGQGSVLGAFSTSRTQGGGDTTINYSPQLSLETDGSGAYTQYLPRSSDAIKSSGYPADRIFSSFLFLLCMIGAGIQIRELWSIYRASSPESHEVFG